MEDTQKEKQLQIAERLQLLLLENFEYLLESGEMTPTDRATLSRLLMQNGWSLDPSRMPKGLQDLLTSRIDPEDLDDEDIIPLRTAIS